jgi:hypothetical protein
MRTPERTAAMRKYFTAFPPKWPAFSLLFKTGVVLFAIGATILFYFQNTIMTGIFLIMVSGAVFFYWTKPYFLQKKNFLERPALENMLQWLINDLHTKIKERASEVLRLNMNSLKPENFMIVPYPVYWPEPGVKIENIIKRDTEEGNVLYSVWKVQVIALARNYISYYCCSYDWLNDMLLGEQTNEFFYDDISSVKNDIEPINRKMIGQEEIKSLNTFVFKVTNMSSDNLTVLTKIPELNYSPKLEVSLEKAVQALRIILRKRRYDEDQEPIIIKPESNEDDNETGD